MRMKNLYSIGTLAALSLLSPAAFGALAITNGDFETGGGNNIDDVTSWFDNSNGTFWQGTWQTNAATITPNDTNVVILGSYESGAIQSTTSANVNDGNYLFQSIGTADGALLLPLSFDFGQPNDDNGGRTLGITVGIYAYDGLGGFTPGNNTDVRGATGVTLLDSMSFTYDSVNLDDQIFTQLATLDISSAGTQELFLRFSNYRPADTQSWSALDNITIVPEPTAALLGGLGLLGLLRRRRA